MGFQFDDVQFRGEIKEVFRKGLLGGLALRTIIQIDVLSSSIRNINAETIYYHLKIN